MENLANRFKDYAFKKGYRIQSLQDGKISFEMECWTLLFLYNYGKDPHFYQILLPNIDEADLQQDFQKLSKMQIMNIVYKVGKIFVNEKAVHLSVEQFVYDSDNIERVWDRMLKVLRDMYMDYYFAFSKHANNEKK